MNEGEIVNAVREEVRVIEQSVVQKLQTHVSDTVAQRFTETETHITELRESLNQLREAGAHPAEEKVQDFEKRLVDAEVIIRDIQLKAASLPAANKADDETIFRGKFISNLDEARKWVRAMQSTSPDGPSQRAIDTNLFTTGGKLSAETFDRFLDYLIEKQVALSRVTTRRMMSPQGHTDQLVVARRKLRAATEGTEPNLTNAMSTRRRTLNTVEVIWAEDLTLTFLEDNIERRGAETHIARMLATQFGNDLNDLAWNGDSTPDSSGADDFVNINDGWITLMLADGNCLGIDASLLSSPTNTDILFNAYKNLAVEFKGMPDLAFFVPIPFANRYADEVSTRETPLGDQVLVQGFPVLRYFGMPVLPEPHLYEENQDKVVLTPIQNLYHGIQRNMTIDSEWKPRKRAIEFTITARNDYEYATGEGIVITHSVPAANL